MVALVALSGLAFEARADMVTDWNVIALATMPPAIIGPPQARVMGYVQAAVFDAVNAVERKYTPYAEELKAPKASAAAAAAAASHGMLIRFHPTQKAMLDTRLNASLGPVPDGDPKNEGLELGRTVAERIYELSRKNAADAPNPAYTPGTDPWS